MPQPSTVPPTPSDNYTSTRLDETRLRRRLLEGVWRSDLEQRMREQVGTVRANAWGRPSLALNFFASVVRELSTLYDSPYRVTHDRASEEQTAALVDRMRLGGIFGIMPEVQRLTLGLREEFIRPHVDARGRLRFRTVTPDMTLAKSTVDEPDRPIAVQEYRLRHLEGSDEPEWTIDYLSIEDPQNPIYKVCRVAANGYAGEDITQQVLGGDFSGSLYPYRRKVFVPAEGSDVEVPDFGRDSDGNPLGEPVLPYILYHAKGTRDRLFDPFAGHEIVDGTLDTAVLHQMLMHVFKDASWPQRYTVNLEVGAAEVIGDGSTRRAEVIADPSTILGLHTPRDEETNLQPMVGQWQAGGDVEKMEGTLANIVARLATEAGIPPSDIQRLGGTARSGAAISLTNAGKRKAQRKYGAIFRDYDERLVALCAIMLNSATGSSFVEGGYTVVYPQLPLSPEELKARREEVIEMLDRRLITPVDAYIELHPGTTETQAALKVAEAAGETVESPQVAPVEDMRAALDEVEGALESMTDDDRDDVREALEESASVLRALLGMDGDE